VLNWCEVLPNAIELGTYPNVLEYLRLITVELPANDVNVAIGLGNEGCECIEECRLACTVGTQETQNLRLRYREGYVLYGHAAIIVDLL
jgi:ubiquitin C-terminal hydrolase